jgi:hypothetical protein
VPIKRKDKEVEESQRDEAVERRNLDLSATQQEFKEIERRLELDSSLRLDLRWILHRENAEK